MSITVLAPHNGPVTESRTARIEVRLFGRPAVVRDGVPMPLRGAFPAAVVARLALADGASLSAEQLVVDLWADPPAAAVQTLRANVSRLRAAGLQSAIVGGRGGYRLHADEIDVAAFVRAAETGLDGEDDRLPLAERLWLAEPLSGIDAPFAEAARARLLDLRRMVAERLARRRIEAGDLAEVIERLPAIIAEQPLHEEPVRLLATALARSGRSADALECIDAFAARLAADRGLDVSPALDTLRLAILRHAPEFTSTAGFATRRHGVPLPITRFVGRRAELDAVAEARRESRLVTLTGPGGVGKTRLAVESLHRDDLDDSQWMLELAALDDPASIDAALAALVGVTNATRDAIAGRLSGAGTLLVLDNAEHLLPAVASLVSDLLATSPGLSVLVTSREPLRIPGERRVPVGSMLGDHEADAIELFRQRAADAQPAFALDAVSTPRVRELVRLLDGMPLALELTAARLDVMELGELIRSLRAAEPTLLGGEGEGRHASLANTVAWSVRLLDRHERELLAQLARFAGAVPLEAIAGICRVAGGDVRALATALAQQSLVAVEGAEDARRFRLLETVKLFARDLPAEDEPGAWSRRHAVWFADWVDAHERALHDARSAQTYARFDSLRPDLLLALRAAIEQADRSLAVRLAGGQAWYWFLRGSLADSLRWLDAALALPGPCDPFDEARALWGAVMLIYRSGEKFAGEGYAARGLPIAEASGDPTLLALFLACNGMWASDHEAGAGEPLLAAADALVDRVEPWARAELLVFRSIACIYADRRAEALTALDSAARSAHETGNIWAHGTALWRMGHLLIGLRREPDALRALAAALTAIEGQEDVLARILIVHAAAIALTGLDRAVDAARLYGAVDHLGAQYGFDREAVDDEPHQRYRRRARAALTPREWNPAYTDGRRLTLDEALALVHAAAARVT